MEFAKLLEKPRRSATAVALGVFGVGCTLGVGPIFAAHSAEAYIMRETQQQPVFISDETQLMISGLHAGGFVGAELIGAASLAGCAARLSRRED